MTPSSMARSCQIGAREVTKITKYTTSHLGTQSSECIYHVTSMEQHRILRKSWNSFIAVAGADRLGIALTSTLQAVQEAPWNVPLLLDLNCLRKFWVSVVQVSGLNLLLNGAEELRSYDGR